jgi:hypothetical protein
MAFLCACITGIGCCRVGLPSIPGRMSVNHRLSRSFLRLRGFFQGGWGARLRGRARVCSSRAVIRAGAEAVWNFEGGPTEVQATRIESSNLGIRVPNGPSNSRSIMKDLSSGAATHEIGSLASTIERTSGESPNGSKNQAAEDCGVRDPVGNMLPTSSPMALRRRPPSGTSQLPPPRLSPLVIASTFASLARNRSVPCPMLLEGV